MDVTTGFTPLAPCPASRNRLSSGIFSVTASMIPVAVPSVNACSVVAPRSSASAAVCPDEQSFRPDSADHKGKDGL
jgi:hypothetical protein